MRVSCGSSRGPASTRAGVSELTSSLALAMEAGRCSRTSPAPSAPIRRAAKRFTRLRLARCDAACISDGRKNKFGGNELGRSVLHDLQQDQTPERILSKSERTYRNYIAG